MGRQPDSRNLSEGERPACRLHSADDPVHIDALAAASRIALPEPAGARSLELELRETYPALPAGKYFVRRGRGGVPTGKRISLLRHQSVTDKE